MVKIRLLAGLVAVAGILAVSATPALAEFESANGAAQQGKFHTSTMTFEGGGATLTCTSIQGKWYIQVFGHIIEQQRKFAGPHLGIDFQVSIGCKAKSSIIKEVNAELSQCIFHVTSASAGSTTGVGAFIPLTEGAKEEAGCVVTVKVLGTCIIKIPTTDESSFNFNLSSNSFANSGKNLLITATDSGITEKPNAACLGIKETNEGKLKSEAGGIVAEEAKLI